MKYLKALRLPFVMVSLINFLVIWFSTGKEAPILFWLSTAGICLAHLAFNLWNDYFDIRGDNQNNHPTPFSGGSRVMQDHKMSVRSFRNYTLVLSFLALIVCIFIFILTGFNTKLFLLVLLALLLGFFYTAPPIKFVYRGWGELIVFLNFGPLIYFGINFLNHISVHTNALFISMIMGLLTARILYINEFPDYDADKLVNKRTLVVILSPEIARKLLPGFSMMSVLLLIFIYDQLHNYFFLLFLILVLSDAVIYITKVTHVRSFLGIISHNLFGLVLIFYFKLLES